SGGLQATDASITIGGGTLTATDDIRLNNCVVSLSAATGRLDPGAKDIYVVGGTLNLDSGQVTCANLRLSNFGTLQGVGTVRATLINDGIVYVGGNQQIGTITVDAYRQTGGTLVVDIGDPASNPSSDRLTVVGNAFIGSSAVLQIQPPGYTPAPPAAWSIM